MKTFPITMDEDEYAELGILLTLRKVKNKQQLVLGIIKDAIDRRRKDVNTVKSLIRKRGDNETQAMS